MSTSSQASEERRHRKVVQEHPAGSSRRRLEHRLERVTQGRTGRWLERLARLGYGTRGLVFALVGLIAMRAAWGIGQATGARGVIHEMARQPFGKALLIVTTVGMTGYVLWRYVQAALDPFVEGGGARARIRRLGYLGSGTFYGLLALTAAQLAFNFAETKGTRRKVTAWVLTMPYGSWLIAFAGTVLIGVGLHALWRAATASFMKLYPAPRAGASHKRRVVAKRIGQVGLSALGLTLCLIGGLVILAALTSNPDQAVGIGGALSALGNGPHGAVLLGVAGLGFVFYGMHCGVLGAYRLVRPRPQEEE